MNAEFQQFENEDGPQQHQNQELGVQQEGLGEEIKEGDYQLELNRIESELDVMRSNSVNYAEIHSNIYTQIITKAFMGLFYNVLKMALTYYVYYIVEQEVVVYEPSVNEKDWLQELLLFFLVSQIFNTIYAFCSTLCGRLTCCTRTQNCLPVAVIFNLILIALITYKLGQGYFINYHLDDPQYESRSVHIARMVTLFFGVFYFGFLGCFVCAIIVVILDAKQQKQQRTNLINNIKSVPYGGLVFKEGVECAICWESFKEKDHVFQLKCHTMHIFHQKCLEDWMRRGSKTICPLCRKPIQA